MRKFIYTVQDANGVHARPAGLQPKHWTAPLRWKMQQVSLLWQLS